MGKKTAFNPYLPGWEYVPDGEPHVFGDRIYVYGSHDRAFGNAYCGQDYTVWSAPVDDLADWTCHGVVYRNDQDLHNYGNPKELWAPDVCRGTDGRFYLYYCRAFVPEIGIAVSDRPEGPFEFYDYVRDEKGDIWDKELPFDPGVLFEDENHIWLYSGFGSVPLPIPDGMQLTPDMVKGFLNLNDVPDSQIQSMMEQIELMRNPSTHCSCLRLAKDMKTVLAKTHVAPAQVCAAGTDFEGHAFFEASSIRKINGIYYLVYSAENGNQLCYATSEYPDRDFRYRGVIVSNADLEYCGNPVPRAYYANNHGGLAEIQGKWYIFYHRHTNKTQFSRQGCAEPVQILADGSIPQVEITSCGLNGGPIPADTVCSAHVCCNLMGRRGACELDMQNGDLTDIPYVTEECTGTDQVNQFIHNLKDGDVCGIKYLDFHGENQANVVLRGKGKLQILLDNENGTCIGEVFADACEWTAVHGKITETNGVHAVFFRVVDTEKALDFSEVSFQCLAPD